MMIDSIVLFRFAMMSRRYRRRFMIKNCDNALFVFFLLLGVVVVVVKRRRRFLLLLLFRYVFTLF